MTLRRSFDQAIAELDTLLDRLDRVDTDQASRRIHDQQPGIAAASYDREGGKSHGHPDPTGTTATRQSPTPTKAEAAKTATAAVTAVQQLLRLLEEATRSSDPSDLEQHTTSTGEILCDLCGDEIIGKPRGRDRAAVTLDEKCDRAVRRLEAKNIPLDEALSRVHEQRQREHTSVTV